MRSKSSLKSDYAEHCKQADILTSPLRDCLSYYNSDGAAEPGSSYYGGPAKWHALRAEAQSRWPLTYLTAKSDAPLSGDSQVRWFLIGQARWFAAFGLQAVLFPYLIVNVLFESPDRVGLAQMCLLAPALALMVPGGMLADAVDLRTLLVRLQLLTVCPSVFWLGLSGPVAVRFLR